MQSSTGEKDGGGLNVIGQKWYKFDDGDVSEAKMDDDEELRAQCYGGEYTSGLVNNSIFFILLFVKTSKTTFYNDQPR